MTAFPNLFSPLTIRGTTFRNRIMSTGHGTSMATDGTVNDRLLAYHEARAAGGAGRLPGGEVEVVLRGHLQVEGVDRRPVPVGVDPDHAQVLAVGSPEVRGEEVVGGDPEGGFSVRLGDTGEEDGVA